MSILVTMIAVVLVFAYSVVLMEGGLVTVLNFLDIPSLLLILLLVIPILISAGLIKDFRLSFKRAFLERMSVTRAELKRSMEAVMLAVRANWMAGIFSFLIGSCFIWRLDMEELGGSLEQYIHLFLVNMSVAVLPLFYAVVLNLILLAVYGRLKKRCIDYMGEE